LTGQESTAVELGLQLAMSTGLVLLMVVIHSLGLFGISRMLRLKDDRLKEKDFGLSALGLMASFGLLVFALHIFEILVFAGFYMLVGALADFEEALYYSASAYATLGRTSEYFPEDWRLIGAMEALAGFILIGWSTAFMVSAMRKIID
jgi:hypothetical protein